LVILSLLSILTSLIYSIQFIIIPTMGPTTGAVSTDITEHMMGRWFIPRPPSPETDNRLKTYRLRSVRRAGASEAAIIEMEREQHAERLRKRKERLAEEGKHHGPQPQIPSPTEEEIDNFVAGLPKLAVNLARNEREDVVRSLAAREWGAGDEIPVIAVSSVAGSEFTTSESESDSDSDDLDSSEFDEFSDETRRQLRLANPSAFYGNGAVSRSTAGRGSRIQGNAGRGVDEDAQTLIGSAGTFGRVVGQDSVGLIFDYGDLGLPVTSRGDSFEPSLGLELTFISPSKEVVLFSRKLALSSHSQNIVSKPRQPQRQHTLQPQRRQLTNSGKYLTL
jgi:hypothetical protein